MFRCHRRGQGFCGARWDLGGRASSVGHEVDQLRHEDAAHRVADIEGINVVTSGHPASRCLPVLDSIGTQDGKRGVAGLVRDDPGPSRGYDLGMDTDAGPPVVSVSITVEPGGTAAPAAGAPLLRLPQDLGHGSA